MSSITEALKAAAGKNGNSSLLDLITKREQVHEKEKEYAKQKRKENQITAKVSIHTHEKQEKASPKEATPAKRAVA